MVSPTAPSPISVLDANLKVCYVNQLSRLLQIKESVVRDASLVNSGTAAYIRNAPDVNTARKSVSLFFPMTNVICDIQDF